jgi:four helix bundle protein
MKKDNVVRDKSYAFALRVVKLYQFLINEKKEFVLSRQILRSGTSIGANVEEAIGGQSGRDFQSKMAIAYKEARETHYWIRILKDSDYLSDEYSQSILSDCDELMKILGSIQKTMKIRN